MSGCAGRVGGSSARPVRALACWTAHNARAKLAGHHKAAQGDVKEQKRPPTEIGTAIMISEVQRVIVILVAMVALGLITLPGLREAVQRLRRTPRTEEQARRSLGSALRET